MYPNGSSIDPILQRQTAAQYLGTAVRELFPKAELIGGQGTTRFFYYDVVFPFVFQKEMLPLIEERMRALLREKHPVKELEMDPQNAAAWVETQDQPRIAERLRTAPTALVTLCQIGPYVDCCPYPFSPQLTGVFKLLEGFPVGGNATRIVGAWETDKETLKQSAKAPLSSAPRPSTRNHLALLRHWFFPLEEGRWVWLPEAEAIKHQLFLWWRDAHLKENFRLLSSSATSEEELRRAHRAVHANATELKTAELGCLHTGVTGEGLFETTHCFTDRAYLLCLKEKLLEEVISSLQSILKIPKLLGFEFEILLTVPRVGRHKGSRRAADLFRQGLEALGVPFSACTAPLSDTVAHVSVQLFDALGRAWEGPFLACAKSAPDEKSDLLVRSAFGSMERLMGLALENAVGQKLNNATEWKR